MVNIFCSKGTSNVLQGGGQWSTVKDHIFTFFWDPSLSELVKNQLFLTLPFVCMGLWEVWRLFVKHMLDIVGKQM